VRREQLDHLIRAAAGVLGENEVIVVGSQSILASIGEEDLPRPHDLVVAKLVAGRPHTSSSSENSSALDSSTRRSWASVLASSTPGSGECRPHVVRCRHCVAARQGLHHPGDGTPPGQRVESGGMNGHFTLDQARAVIPELQQQVAHLVELRADLVEAEAALRRGERPAAGGLPEVKALEARLQEAVDWFEPRGIQLKGIAPVIVDFISELDGEPVLLCWIEGEPSLGWYHRPELGFMGRRRLPDTT